tara:strand:- start:1030 stop:1716 length:687 start_codon:yes stop_codon:yes gene_type:complete
MNIGQALRELNLRAGATEEEIHRAYRKLVAKWHPDKHQNDLIRLSESESRIKNINRAFEKLQSVGFQKKKTTRKKDRKAEKTSGTKKKSENRNSKQKADGKRNDPNPRTHSANSKNVHTHKDVKCPGCGEWFREEKLSCPTCFRENYQGTGGWQRIKHNTHRSLAKLGFALVLGGIIGWICQLDDAFQILDAIQVPSLPLEIRLIFWIWLPFLITGGAMLIKRSVSRP